MRIRLTLLELLFALPYFAAPPALAMKVLIDPGHGGHDQGAVHNNIREAEIVLSIAKQVAERLKSQHSIEVVLTRDKDEYLSLQERTQMAKQTQADILVSIHANASPDETARGAEFYIQNILPPDEEAMFLANRENQNTKPWQHEDASFVGSSDVQVILEDLARQRNIARSRDLSVKLVRQWENSVKPRNNAIQQAPFHVLSNSPIPAVLAEVGFLSHSKEGQKLTKPEVQKKIAEQLADGIANFKEFIDKDRALPIK